MMNVDFRVNSAQTAVCGLVSLISFVLLSAPALAEQPLLNINDDLDLSTVKAQAVALSVVSTDETSAIRMESTPDKDWPGITIRLD